MNITRLGMLTTAALLTATTADASNVADTDLVTFSANTTAKAAEVNQNFTVIKNAVNTKQNSVTGTCATGTAIGTINSDGTVVCETDDDTLGTLSCTAGQSTQWNGSAWICADINPVQTFTEYFPGSSFEQVTNGATTEANVRRHAYQGYAWSDVTGAQYLNVPLHLPQGATITELTCYNYDNDATNNIGIMATYIISNTAVVGQYTNQITGNIPATNGATTTLNSATITGSVVVDNTTNAYRIYIYSLAFGGSTDIRFYGCKLTYQK